MELIMIVACNVKYYRFEKGFSQEKLGELTGLSTRYISDIERAKFSMPIPTIEKVAKALGVEPYCLFQYHAEANHLPERIDMYQKNKKAGTHHFGE